MWMAWHVVEERGGNSKQTKLMENETKRRGQNDTELHLQPTIKKPPLSKPPIFNLNGKCGIVCIHINIFCFFYFEKHQFFSQRGSMIRKRVEKFGRQSEKRAKNEKVLETWHWNCKAERFSNFYMIFYENKRKTHTNRESRERLQVHQKRLGRKCNISLEEETRNTQTKQNKHTNSLSYTPNH